MKQRIGGEDGRQVTPHVHFPLDAMAASTFFVNHSLRIEWVKVDWRDRLSRAIAAEWKENDSETVFDTLLHASLKELFFNWQPLFSFVYKFLRRSTPAEIFNQVAPALSTGAGEKETTGPSLFEFKKIGRLESCSFQVEDNDGKMQSKRLYGVVLSEGVVFVLNDEPDTNTKIRPSTLVGTAPGKIPFGVLSVKLDNANSMVETLLPETYYRLVKKVWEESDRTLAKYAGHRAGRSGNELQYVISGKTTSDPVYETIQCAIELRKRMRTVEIALQVDGGCHSRIRLNIGISWGKDHLRKKDPTTSMAFMLPGGASDQARFLSDIARNGAIWITKSALSHIPPNQRRWITFGLYRKNRLIPNIFAQASDLRHAKRLSSLGEPIHPLAVTRIISLRTA